MIMYMHCYNNYQQKTCTGYAKSVVYHIYFLETDLQFSFSCKCAVIQPAFFKENTCKAYT